MSLFLYIFRNELSLSSSFGLAQIYVLHTFSVLKPIKSVHRFKRKQALTWGTILLATGLMFDSRPVR